MEKMFNDALAKNDYVSASKILTDIALKRLSKSDIPDFYRLKAENSCVEFLKEQKQNSFDSYIIGACAIVNVTVIPY